MSYALLHIYCILYLYFIGLQLSFSVGYQIYRDLEKNISNKWGKYTYRQASVHC
jgi:hypothetical protein